MNVIVITGASSGMGREFALQLDRGLKTIDEFWLIARRADRMKELSGHMRHRVKILPLNLTAEGDISLFGEVLQEEKPKIRMLVNCAGYGLIGDFSALSAQEQAGEVMLNCRALMEITHACLPYMKEKSRIIQLASSAAFLPQPGFAVYAATKAFVLSFSRALREELKERGIFVTAVCPGPVQTEFFDVAERYGSVLGIKKYVMAQPERVVRSALAASCKNRPMSVYGPAMNAFWLMTRLLPQDPVLHLTYRMKKKGECRCADPGKDCQTE